MDLAGIMVLRTFTESLKSRPGKRRSRIPNRFTSCPKAWVFPCSWTTAQFNWF